MTALFDAAQWCPPVGASATEWRACADRYAAHMGNRRDKAAHYAALGALVARYYATMPRDWQAFDSVDAIVARRPDRNAYGWQSAAQPRTAALIESLAGPLAWRQWLASAQASGMAAAMLRWQIGISAADNDEPIADVAHELAQVVTYCPPQSSEGWHAELWNRWADSFDGDVAHGYAVALEYRQCEGCRVNYRADEPTYTYGWRARHCEGCNESMVECTDCLEPVSDDYAIAFDDGYRCDTCADSWTPPGCDIRGYGWVPSVWHWGHVVNGVRVHDRGRGDTAALMLGAEVELETNGARSGFVALSEWTGITDRVAYCKDDASLSDGVEVVTHPMTLDAHRDLWSSFPGQSLRLQGWDADHADTAGMHVHASRDSFRSRSHLARFGLLWLANENDLVRVVGRSSTYAEWSARARRYVVWHATGRDLGPRYSPCNFQPGQTVEVRIFRSSFDPEYLTAALELVHAAHRYTADMGAHEVLAGALDSRSWFAWIIESGEYPAAAKLITTTETRN